MKKYKKPLLIAEIGINHNGNLDTAKKLINIAKQSNFDCVKFQKRDVNLVYSKDEGEDAYHMKEDEEKPSPLYS